MRGLKKIFFKTIVTETRTEKSGLNKNFFFFLNFFQSSAEPYERSILKNNQKIAEKGTSKNRHLVIVNKL